MYQKKKPALHTAFTNNRPKRALGPRPNIIEDITTTQDKMRIFPTKFVLGNGWDIQITYHRYH